MRKLLLTLCVLLFGSVAIAQAPATFSYSITIGINPLNVDSTAALVVNQGSVWFQITCGQAPRNFEVTPPGQPAMTVSCPAGGGASVTTPSGVASLRILP